MMELHYYTLKRQAEYARSRLLLGKITASYTRQKNEQVLIIETHEGHYHEVVLSANARYPFFIIRPPTKRPRLSTEVVSQLVGREITDISIWENERIIAFHLEDGSQRYVIQLFRNRANFYLLDSDDRIVNCFKHSKKYIGSRFQLKSMDRKDPVGMEREAFISILRLAGEITLDSQLRRSFLHFTPEIIREVSFRSAIDETTALERISDDELSLLHETIQQFFHDCQTDPPRVYLPNGVPGFFTLTEFRIWKDIDVQIFEDINEALRFYVFRRIKWEQEDQKKQKLGEAMQRQLSHLDYLITQLENLPEGSERKAYYRKIGDLLLSQLHQIPAGQAEVEVIDYYDPEQRLIKVRLDPEKSVQENAEIYFRKAKEDAKKQKKRIARVNYLKDQKQKLSRLVSHLKNVSTVKELHAIEKQLSQLGFAVSERKQAVEPHRPYKQYFYREWEIWVGKSARDNDEMTFRRAHKEDWWLHAQGASGSHVVIRNPGRQSKIPGEVLEYAARLAAQNSTARHSSYVPVLYTQVKFIRKQKGTSPGTVIPQRAKTIFVEPKQS
ncbi:MAG: NFACT family protein [Calditrichia bacterium]